MKGGKSKAETKKTETKTEYTNRGYNQGGFSNRGPNGYQRDGSHMNRGGGMVVNGTSRTVATRVFATA
ncbi:adaptin family protein [Actinidia rufa]|uniref:Adaptin family protein n=1 Tax=Actinidia rufa TaxID=165716 RepID=A0A7J0E372_9ERIC|nr:adaptin family protein [Actinidia rufa]